MHLTLPRLSRLTLPVIKYRASVERIFLGGRLHDWGRLPRYAAFAALGGVLIWMPITGYLKSAPVVYKSHASLILPGSGASASMNLTGIGQASSYANSAFASNSVSPTETYKRLLNADRILETARKSLGETRAEFGKPRVNLVDQTSLIHVEMAGYSPKQSQARSNALLTAFFSELKALRSDEQRTREDSGLVAINDYRKSVATTRADIERLQKTSGLISPEQYDELLSGANASEIELHRLSAVLSDRTQTVRALETALNLPANLAAVTLKLFADAEFVSLNAERATFAAKLADLSSQYGRNHPKVQARQLAYKAALAGATSRARQVTGMTDEQLARLDFAPDGARAELLARLVRQEAERAGMQSQYEVQKARLEKQRKLITQLAAPAARLQDLQRDFTVAEAVFASAIARSQTSKSDVYASYPLVQVLENPSLPEKPTSPNRKIAVAAGIAASFCLLVGLGLGWIRLALITKLRRKPEDRADVV
ncbi:hypothetical protein N4R57_15505 [Rhodobacteraceae bacterium D3-12]|nr:hypothetical protein N4R57_15505 [Rhodobacteraceae bacterium D3-12]